MYSEEKERVMNTQLQTVWGSVLGELEIVLSQANFQTWLKGTELAELEETRAVVFVPISLLVSGFKISIINKSSMRSAK